MDESTFQHELQSLKQRIADITPLHLLTLARQPPTLPQPSPADKFSAQMEDAKQHITTLEQEFQRTVQPQLRASFVPEPSPATTHPHATRGLVDPLAPDSTPLITALGDDITHLKRRMFGVELGLSDLDDKMDRLDPDRFTPPASESTPDEGIRLPTASFSAPEASGPELAFNQDDLRHTGSFQSPSTSESADQMAKSLLQMKLRAGNATLSMLAKYDDKLAVSGQFNEENAKVVRDIVKLHTKLAADHSWNAPRLPKDDRQTHHCAPMSEPRRGSLPASELDALSCFTGNHEQPPRSSTGESRPEGVAFRDLEITRLDELLRSAQESARLGEQQACTDRQRFEALQAEHEARSEDLAQLQERDSERTELMDRLKVEAAQAELHVQQMNDYLQTKDEQRERYLESYHQAVEESREKSQVIFNMQRRMDDLQGALQDAQGIRDEEIDQVMQGQDKQIKRLQDFCEQKDDIFRSQEQIIARGAGLMQQKDEEIEELSRRARSWHDENDEVKRQCLRLTELLRDRDGELATLKQQIEALPEQPAQTSSHDEGLPEPVTVDEPSPFAAPRRISWYPRPIVGDRRLASESHRASAWAQNHEQQTPVFGQPSPMGPWRPHNNGPRRRISSPHPRRIYSLNNQEDVLEERPPIGRNRAPASGEQDARPSAPQNREVQHANGSGIPAASKRPHSRRHAEGRHGLPMDRMVWPPLPANVPTRRMHSVADMRMAASNGPPHGVGRHRSMQELKRRDHQAYVETEAEDGGDV